MLYVCKKISVRFCHFYMGDSSTVISVTYLTFSNFLFISKSQINFALNIKFVEKRAAYVRFLMLQTFLKLCLNENIQKFLHPFFRGFLWVLYFGTCKLQHQSSLIVWCIVYRLVYMWHFSYCIFCIIVDDFQLKFVVPSMFVSDLFNR